MLEGWLDWSAIWKRILKAFEKHTKGVGRNMRTWEILKKLFKSSGLQDELVESTMILIGYV